MEGQGQKEKESKGKGASIDEVLKLAQVITIFCVGAWTVNSYLTFEKDQQILKNRNLELLNEQIYVDKEIKKSTLMEISDPKLTLRHVMKIECGNGPGLYTVEYSYDFENVSKTEVEISWTLANRFIGAIFLGPEEETSVHINHPPIPYLKIESEGAVDWREAGNSGSVIDGRGLLLEELSSSGFNFKRSGGGTNTFKPGQSGHNVDTFLVKANSGKYFAIVFSYGVNQEKAGGYVKNAYDWAVLPECKKNP